MTQYKAPQTYLVMVDSPVRMREKMQVQVR